MPRVLYSSCAKVARLSEPLLRASIASERRATFFDSKQRGCLAANNFRLLPVHKGPAYRFFSQVYFPRMLSILSIKECRLGRNLNLQVGGGPWMRSTGTCSRFRCRCVFLTKPSLRGLQMLECLNEVAPAVLSHAFQQDIETRQGPLSLFESPIRKFECRLKLMVWCIDE